MSAALNSTTRPGVMVDVDGILVHFLRSLSHRVGRGMFSEQDSPEWGQYPYPIHRDEWWPAAKWAWSREGILHAGLVDGAREGIEAWHREGIAVHICTSRPEQFAEDTQQALHELGLRWSTFHAAMRCDKIARCASQNLTMIVDDKPTTLVKAHASGLHGFSLRWPYNRQAPGRLCADWRELSGAVIEQTRSPQPPPGRLF